MNLEQLRHRVRQQYVEASTLWPIVAITLHLATLQEEERRMWDSVLSPTEPGSMDEHWTFLGYDIADGGLLSCLSNCGYSSDSAPLLRDEWSPLLNERHLFVDLQKAVEFKTLTDARVEEHAPFFVFGLYVVESYQSLL